jgi:SAM-dependent methyltransferase
MPISQLGREEGACPHCRANVRFRGIVHLLSMCLFGKSLPIDDFPKSAAELTGLGMSDAYIYADRLAKQCRYTNTYYHQEPRLDIMNPPADHLDRYDFVISSDVLEHVNPPVSVAFRNLRRLLKKGGALIFSVPFKLDGETVEHYPELHEYTIEKRGETYVLVNRTADGRTQEFSDLVFHGGPGSTLEMRLFSEPSLRAELAQAGFADVYFHREPAFESGVYWPEPWSVPITAIAA